MATITINIPASTEATLRRQAAAAGKPVDQFVSDVLQAQTSAAHLLADISGCSHTQFLSSGLTEEQLADRLEREAELHRNRLDSTLAQLERKFSAGAIVDELSGYLRDGQGAAMVRNLKGQVRDNPLALGVMFVVHGRIIRPTGIIRR